MRIKGRAEALPCMPVLSRLYRALEALPFPIPPVCHMEAMVKPMPTHATTLLSDGAWPDCHPRAIPALAQVALVTERVLLRQRRFELPSTTSPCRLNCQCTSLHSLRMAASKPTSYRKMLVKSNTLTRSYRSR